MGLLVGVEFEEAFSLLVLFLVGVAQISSLEAGKCTSRLCSRLLERVRILTVEPLAFVGEAYLYGNKVSLILRRVPAASMSVKEVLCRGASASSSSSTIG